MLYDSHGNIFYCCFQDIQKVSIKISEIQLLFFFLFIYFALCYDTEDRRRKSRDYIIIE